MTSAFTNLFFAPIAELLKQSSRYCKLVGGLVMICYALVLLVAAGFNVGAKKVRHNLARATVNRRSCAAKVPAQKVGRITM